MSNSALAVALYKCYDACVAVLEEAGATLVGGHTPGGAYTYDAKKQLGPTGYLDGHMRTSDDSDYELL